MHNGFLTLDKEKMSKSLGNFFSIEDILKHYPGKVIRYFLATTHYRSSVDFSEEQLKSAGTSLARFEDTLNLLTSLGGGGKVSDQSLEDLEKNLSTLTLLETETRLFNKYQKVRLDFESAMDDDFNAPQATAALFDLLKEINPVIRGEMSLKPEVLSHGFQMFLKLGWVLGLFQEVVTSPEVDRSLVNDLMDLILEIRQNARTKKDWATADRIRDRLKELGLVIEDVSKDKSIWKRNS